MGETMGKFRLSGLVLLTIFLVSFTGCGSKQVVNESATSETESVTTEIKNEAVPLQMEEVDFSFEENTSAEDSDKNDAYTEYSTDSYTISIPNEWIPTVRTEEKSAWFYPEDGDGAVVDVMLQLQDSGMVLMEENYEYLKEYLKEVGGELLLQEYINIGNLGICSHFKIEVKVIGVPMYLDGVFFRGSENTMQAVTFIWNSEFDNQYLDEWDYIMNSIKIDGKETTTEVSTDETLTGTVNNEIVDETVAAGDANTSENITSLQSKAVNKASEYLKYYAFSRDGLVSQLVYVGFSTADAGFGADNCGADWNEEALEKAQEYLKFTAFSCSGLATQLEFQKFTAEQAKYGAVNCGANWSEQAAKKAKEYLAYSSLSRDELLSQLVYEKFTTEEAEYGVKAAGY